MPIPHPEHAQINLLRLVESLRTRSEQAQLEKESWVQVRSGRQTVRHVRELFDHVQQEGKMPSDQLKHVQAELYDLEKIYDIAVESHPIPSTSKASPTAALPPKESKMTANTPPVSDPAAARLPQPLTKSLPSTSSSTTALTPQTGSALPESDPSLLLLEESDPPLLPLIKKTARDELFASGSEKGAGMAAGGAGMGFVGSSQLHDELAGQLADMSRQLKNNALHFSKSLEEEKSLLEVSSTIITDNLEKTRSSKKQLSAVSKKTRGTTWLTLISIGIVILGFSWTMVLIRLT